MARRALPLAPVLLALALSTAGCSLGEPRGAAGDPPPLVTHPSSGPSGVPAAPGETPAPQCPEADDVTVALTGGAGDRAVQIVPRCDELEVPVPFTVPTDDPGPRSV